MELIVEFIRQNQTTTEFLLYLLFFGSLAHAALYRHFNEHTGKVSIAMGMAMAAAIQVSQRRLGYALDSLGEPAILLVLLVIGVVVYRFLAWSDAPTPVALLAAVGIAAIGINAALPDWEITRQGWFGPAVTLLLLVSAAGLVAAPAGEFGGRVVQPLVRAGLLPKRGALNKELRELKKSGARNAVGGERLATRQLRRAEQRIKQAEQKARPARAGIAPDPRTRAPPANTKKRIIKRIEGAEREASRALGQLVRLQQLDRAIQHFDLQQLTRASAVNLSAFTAEQHQALQKNLQEERSRLNLEQRLDRLTQATEHTMVTLRGHLENATNAVNKDQPAAAEGWLEKAAESLQYAGHTSRQIEQLRRQLIQSLQRQTRATANT